MSSCSSVAEATWERDLRARGSTSECSQPTHQDAGSAHHGERV